MIINSIYLSGIRRITIIGEILSLAKREYIVIPWIAIEEEYCIIWIPSSNIDSSIQTDV